jgi:CDP-glucose 4,6-dehydratase
MPLEIRRPEAIRPWQHVLEPLQGYLALAESLWQTPDLAGAYNFGPNTHEATTVRKVIERAQTVFGRGEVIFAEDIAGPHEAGWLALETAKARETLGIRSKWPLSETVDRTIAWYLAQLQGADARDLCEAEIDYYENH